ncbi:hypothetical protein [Micromonospora avicenniae]|uniref:Uncharacterized protein n=1 Tax=Micromonospora avicenniae TaxID=1198245 RepID=A0A1N6TX97_9ACTN|nr:hypothetical protein [Micromonospora avicenniae]SIQ57952.1 hypothetical protein SAMN05444858_103133 [Micromonospora avicenniae]
MRDEDLTRLLTLAAEDVRPSHPAAAGWERARRVRRARRVAGAAATAVVLLTGGAVLALRPADPPAPTTAATATATTTAMPVPNAPVQQPPEQLTYPASPLNRLGDPVTASLSSRPVRQALALYQPVDPETGTEGRIRVLGDDGLVRELDVVTPARTRDASGNEAFALKSGSLSADGRLAAFAQTDEVIVVDLTTAQVRRYPLNGYLEHVLWAGDRLFVGDDDTTYELDRRTGASRTMPLSPWEMVVPDPAGRTDSLLALGGLRDGLTLSRWTRSADRTDRGSRPLDFRALPTGDRVNEFYGRGWQRGDQIAQAGWISTGGMDGLEGVAVVDATTGVVTRLLDLGRDRSKGCCGVLGWDGDAVLLRHDPGGLLRWRPATGEVTGVARDLKGEISLAAG